MELTHGALRLQLAEGHRLPRALRGGQRVAHGGAARVAGEDDATRRVLREEDAGLESKDTLNSREHVQKSGFLRSGC